MARLILTEPAESTLKLADDGKLPELRLREPGEGPVKQAGSAWINPLVLFGLLALSVAASVALVFAPSGRQGPTRLIAAQQAARKTIEERFFGDGTRPYEVLLREAHRAHQSGDLKRERLLYRQVFTMLQAERGPFDRGLTGSQERDRELRELITILLLSE
ncbi:MAG: hypothetical protein ACUVUC_01870 [Thermoguttaceae bacterium]